MQAFKEIYNLPDKIVVTAHRGFSGKYPENTLVAFEEAVKIGADIIEFDVRGSKDDIPVILHDETLDRTTNGFGLPENMNLAELKKLNASFWEGCHDSGIRLNKAKVKNLRIPSLEESFELLKDKAYMNVQVYTDSFKVIQNIIELYDKFNLYEKAFFMLPSFKQAKVFRGINSRVAICVGEERENLQKHKVFGVDFIQPYKTLINTEFCKKIQDMNLCANMFYSNTNEENEKYIKCGIKGIMTDRPDILIQ